jgi:hypothetical protein
MLGRDRMYGTVAKLRVRSGREADLVSHLEQYRGGLARGFVASALYRADDGDGHWLAVVFESKDAYEANADSPEQDSRYRELRELLESDPEWHDGEVLLRMTE